MKQLKMSDLQQMKVYFLGQECKEQLNASSYLGWRDGWMDRQMTVAKVVDNGSPQWPCRLSMVSRCWLVLHTTVAAAILSSADQAQSTVPLRVMVYERDCSHLILLLWPTTCLLKREVRTPFRSSFVQTTVSSAVQHCWNLECVWWEPTIMQTNTGKYSTVLSTTQPVVLYTCWTNWRQVSHMQTHTHIYIAAQYLHGSSSHKSSN